jgi:hypothetical protein
MYAASMPATRSVKQTNLRLSRSHYLFSSCNRIAGKNKIRCKYFSLVSHRIRAKLCADPIGEEAFSDLEADEGADDSPKDIVATLPNKKRLTPLSIMVCDTMSKVRSHTLLKVLFDPGSTVTFISRKCLPRHCKPCPVAKSRSVNTLAGSCTASNMVVLCAIRLPELDKNRIINQRKALVFDGNIRYDLILGADFLAKSGIDIKYSSGTIE